LPIANRQFIAVDKVRKGVLVQNIGAKDNVPPHFKVDAQIVDATAVNIRIAAAKFFYLHQFLPQTFAAVVAQLVDKPQLGYFVHPIEFH
jgi:hypothetical protein